MNEMNENAPVQDTAEMPQSDSALTNQPQPGNEAAQAFAANRISQVLDNPEFNLSTEALNALPDVGTPEHDYMMKLFRYD